MKRIFTILFAAMLAGQTWAESFTIDNLKYNLKSKNTVSVCKIFDNKPTGDLVIPAEVENDGVTYIVAEIDSWAFNSCEGLTSVTIPNSVTKIGNNAFGYCTNLTSITIPQSVTTIEDYVFEGCRKLTTINVAKENSNYCSVDGVFFNKDMTTILCYPARKPDTTYTIPVGVTRIGHEAFLYCDSLKSIVIPNSVTNIDGWAFYHCNNLTSVTLNNGITCIGESAFAGCSKLTSIIIPESVTEIGASAFSECSGLQSINIPNSVTNIGEYAFCRCERLTSITIPEGITSIPNGLFNYCISLSSIDIPESVSSIGDEAFYGCSKLTSIAIPEGVTNIGKYTFFECSDLTSVTFPNTLTSIGAWSFYFCNNLTSITIPKSVESIGAYAFLNCYHLQITSYATYGGPTLGENVFSDDASDCTITVPCGHEKYYKESDWGKYSNFTFVEDFLYDFTVEANNPEMGSAEILQMPDCSTPATVKATANEGYVFVMWDDKSTNEECRVYVSGDRHCIAYFAPADADINIIPKNYNTAFWYYNTDTKTLHVSGHGELMIEADYMWGDLPKAEVEHVYIEDGFTYIDASTFQNFKALKDVRLPATLKKVGDYSFNGCESLESVVIPEGVREIEYAAFNGCSSMKYAVLPSTLQKMWSRAFGSCSMLDSIVVKCDTAIDLPSMVFYGGSINKKFYIPCGKKSLYTNKECWTISVTSNNNFVETMVYDLSVSSSDSKRGTAAITQAPDCGTNAIVTATAKKNYQFLKWSNGSTANPYEFALEKDLSLTAIFIGKKSEITIEADSNGVVSVPQYAYFEDSVAIEITPKIGYEIDKLTVTADGDKLEIKNNKFMMPSAEVCVKVKFKPIDYKIIVNIKNGKITIPETAHYGDTVKFEIEWNKGAETWFAKRRVDDANGKMILGTYDTRNYFVMPACNVTMTASVDMEEYIIGVWGTGENGIENGRAIVPQKAHCGDTVQFTIIPDDGYVCSLVKLLIYRNGWIEEELTLTNETSFVMPYCESVCLRVEFIEDDGSAVAETAANAVNIYTLGNKIVVENATDEIFVYNAMGRLVGKDAECHVRAEITVNTTGVYIVKTGGTVKRVVVN